MAGVSAPPQSPSLWRRFRSIPVAAQGLTWVLAAVAALVVVAAVGATPKQTVHISSGSSGAATTSTSASSGALAPGPSSAVIEAPVDSTTLPAATTLPAVTSLPAATTVPVPNTLAPSTTRPLVTTTTRPTSTTKPAATTVPGADLCGAPANPYGYNFCGRGSYITQPAAGTCSYFSCIPNFPNGHGYMAECQDGMYTMSGGIQGNCSSHQGFWRAVNAGP